eukprot:scaffold1784_cov116-Cylindrotheca_fusiformis.AAC.9
MKLVHTIPLLSAFILGSYTNTKVSAEEVCKTDGVCFPTKDAAHEYYFKGVDIPVDFGEDQNVAGESWEKTLDQVEKTKEYMRIVRQDEDFEDVRDGCILRNKLCSFWASIGECEANPNYMELQCAPSCQTWYVLRNNRLIGAVLQCPFDKDAPTIWHAGDLNKMFERIVSDPENQNRLTVLSRPPAGPWIVTLDDFFTAEEAQRLIELGGEIGYERSKDVGKQQFDGTYDAVESKSRTSSNAWCVKHCYEDETTKTVLGRIVNTTGVPEENYEYLQLLQYKETQFYGSHHDYINHHTERAQGVRILTVFLYLNDVEEGGGTRFTDLDLTVEAKKGRALIWPSVLDSNPNKKDRRTHHEAMPVKKGIKYGANAWIHQRDFKIPHASSCV